MSVADDARRRKIGPGQGRPSRQLSPHLPYSGSKAVHAIVPAARAEPTVNHCAVEWVAKPGNTALMWSRTPVTWDQVGQPGGNLPVTGVDWAEAQSIAASLEARLPRAVEWEAMAFGEHGDARERRFPWGDADWCPQRAHLRGSGRHKPAPVGLLPAGATPEGMLDVAGNVWEWTADRAPGGGVVVLGGSYNSLVRYAASGYRNDVPPEHNSPGIGFRVVCER